MILFFFFIHYHSGITERTSGSLLRAIRHTDLQLALDNLHLVLKAVDYGISLGSQILIGKMGAKSRADACSAYQNLYIVFIL